MHARANEEGAVRTENEALSVRTENEALSIVGK